MFNLILEFALPLAMTIIRSYIISSSTKKDDEILEIVKVSSRYLADNNTTTVNKQLSNMMEVQTNLHLRG